MRPTDEDHNTEAIPADPGLRRPERNRSQTRTKLGQASRSDERVQRVHVHLATNR